MGLTKMTCGNCKTVYYGKDDRSVDGMCFLCSTTRQFLEMFDLKDISISEIDFNRVRVPQWEKGLSIDQSDWKNYIPQGLKDMWAKLPVESRILAIMFAEREARAIVEIVGKC